MSKRRITDLSHAGGLISSLFPRMSLGFSVLLAALATPITTSGQASVQTTVTRYPIEATADLPCVGQVWFSGVFQLTESTRIDAAGGSHGLSQFVTTQLRAYDGNGNEWTGIHVGQASFNPNLCQSPGCTSVPAENTFVANLLLVGDGSPDLSLTTRFKAVLNANGELTVFFDVTDWTCRY